MFFSAKFAKISKGVVSKKKEEEGEAGMENSVEGGDFNLAGRFVHNGEAH